MKKFRVEITATRVMEITVGGERGFQLTKGETAEDAAEIAAHENAFHNSFPNCCKDIEPWDVTVESVEPI